MEDIQRRSVHAASSLVVVLETERPQPSPCYNSSPIQTPSMSRHEDLHSNLPYLSHARRHHSTSFGGCCFLGSLLRHTISSSAPPATLSWRPPSADPWSGVEDALSAWHGTLSRTSYWSIWSSGSTAAATGTTLRLRPCTNLHHPCPGTILPPTDFAMFYDLHRHQLHQLHRLLRQVRLHQAGTRQLFLLP